MRVTIFTNRDSALRLGPIRRQLLLKGLRMSAAGRRFWWLALCSWLCASMLGARGASAQSALTPALDQAPLRLRPPAPLPPELVGRPVIRLEIATEGGRWQAPVALRRNRLGAPLSAAYARRIVRELLDTGQYASVKASAFAANDGVVLKLDVVPRRIVTEVRIVGGALDDAATRQAAGVDVDDDVTARSLGEIAARLSALYVARGYPDVKVAVEAIDTDELLNVLLEIRVEPGPALRVVERRFELHPRASEELVALSKQYAVRTGNRLDGDALKQADTALVKTLRAAGYHQAAVEHVLDGSGARGALTVVVRAGPKTLLRFEGNETFDADELTQALELDNEAEWNPSTLDSKLQEFYVKRGFLDAEVTLAKSPSADGSEVALVFVVRERERVRVRARQFPCLSGERDAAEVGAEIDSFLGEALPGASLFGPVSSSSLDQRLGPQSTTGARPTPLELDPYRVYDPSVYDRALDHVRDLYRSEGYLSASVGPTRVIRRACDVRSPPGQCVPVGPERLPDVSCLADASGAYPEPSVDPASSCKADAKSNVHCERSVILQIPIHTGPRAQLWDLEFEGNKALVESELLEVTELTLGGPVSQVELENARRRLVERYAEEGYVFAGIEVDLDLSADRTRAKARFIISERQPVTVSAIVIKGARFTQEELIRSRTALTQGGLYRRSLVRATEERLATLGVFTSINVDLEDPEVPARRKVVVIRVAERLPQYIDVSPGFSTGEGVRLTFEYGNTNLAERAIRLIVRIQLGYLPPPLIIDRGVKRRFEALLDQESILFLLERRNSVLLEFPEIGLGPLFRLGVEGVDVRDISRDWALEKRAALLTLSYRPTRAFNALLGGSLELNEAVLFADLIENPDQPPELPDDLQRYFRIPSGLTLAVAQRTGVTWDRRDNAFNATRGTLLSVNAEHVNAYPLEREGEDGEPAFKSHFMHYTGRVAGYLRLSERGVALATSLRWGFNQQLVSGSQTYPDRLFFLGGVDSLRGFTLWSVVPEEFAQELLHPNPDIPDEERPTLESVRLRGGDVMINPRAELRIPLSGIWQSALFLDTGNLWVDTDSVLHEFRLRYSAGAGLRIDTPVGPLALDYGINLIKRPWEDRGAFHFSIGLF
jgi:outer membrane protein insertion porin family